MGIIIRQSIKSVLVNYIGAFLGFLVTMFIMVEYLSAEDIGLLKVILEVGLLFAVLAQLGTTSSAMRFFPYFKDKEKKNNGFFFYLVALPLIGCLIFIPLYILLKDPISAFFSEKSSLFLSYYYWIIPLIFFLVYWSVFETYSNVNMRIVTPKFIREVLVRLLLVAVYVLYGMHVINRDGLVASYIGVYGIAMIAMFIYVSRIAPVSLKHDNSYVSKPLRKDIAKYTSFLVIAALGNTILGKLDIFMITGEMGLSYAGVYTIAYYMGSIIDIPSRSISAISAPLAAEDLKKGNLNEANQLYKKVSLHQLLAGGILFVLIWINIDNIFAAIPNGEVYAQGKYVFLFIGLSKLIDVTLNFGGQLISFSKYYYWSLYLVFILIGLGIVTNLLFIPLFGITGAAIATFIATVLSCSFQQFIVLKKVKGNPYSKGTLKTILIMALLLVVGYFLPSIGNPWIDIVYRTAIVGLIALALVYFTKVSSDVNNIVDIIIEKVTGRNSR